VINRNIRKYLDKKKLLIINKIVHIFLEESISKAKKRRYIGWQKITNSSTFFINDKVKVELGTGVVQNIREDGIIEILLDIQSNQPVMGYYPKKDVSLVLDNKEIIETILESTEDTSEETSEEYSDDFIEESTEESTQDSNIHTSAHTESSSIFSYITHTLYNVKKYIVG